MTTAEGVATLSAVAELVINLSIAQRSHLIYGGDHAVARRSAAKAAESLRRTLDLQVPITIHFTAQAVFCGNHCLERTHPIYRSYAERLWKLGVAAVTFQSGAGEDDLGRFIAALSRAAREHVTRERAEEMLGEADLERVEVQFLRQVVSHATQDEVKALTPGEAEKQWEQLIADLAAISLRPGEAADASEVDTLADHAEAPDYAGAVIDYLKHQQRTLQQEAVLQESDFGQQVSALLGSINPEMRRQLMGAAVAAPDMSPEMLQRLVNVVGYDHLIGALRRLNESGQGIPTTALRTLSMLALIGERGGSLSIAAPPLQAAGGDAVAVDQEQGRTPEEVQGLLDQLLGDEQASRYTSEEYERTLREAEQRAQRVVRLRSGHRPLPMRTEEGEQHFLLVAEQLLARSPDDVELAESVCRESQHSYVRFAEAAAPGPCGKAMRLAREARAATGVKGDGPWIWETPDLLERLRQQLVEAKRTEAEASAELLVAIGDPTIPLLVDVLTTSVSMSVRRRALGALETLSRSPAAALVPLLDAERPWYVQRNAAYVLRRRRDPTGISAAKALWRHAEPRVRLELLGYLLAIGDFERLRYLEEALADRDTEVASTAARNALKEPSDEVVAAVLRRAEAVPNDQVGMPFHLALLRALASSRHPQAVRYLAELPKRRRPLLPWQRERFRQQVTAMVAEES